MGESRSNTACVFGQLPVFDLFVSALRIQKKIEYRTVGSMCICFDCKSSAGGKEIQVLLLLLLDSHKLHNVHSVHHRGVSRLDWKDWFHIWYGMTQKEKDTISFIRRLICSHSISVRRTQTGEMMMTMSTFLQLSLNWYLKGVSFLLVWPDQISYFTHLLDYRQLIDMKASLTSIYIDRLDCVEYTLSKLYIVQYITS